MPDLEGDRDVDGTPSVETLAPLLDRLRELAEEELPPEHMVRVELFTDGDFVAQATHSHGIVDEDTGAKKHERVEYDREQAAFVYGFVTWTEDRGELDHEMTVIERYPDLTR